MPYDNPKGLIAASVILEILAITCVGFRFLSRRKTGASFATDDWLILVALVCSSGLTVMEIYGAAIGVLGVPLQMALEDPRAVDGRVNIAKHLELAAICLGVPTLGFIKLSVSFLYRRIFAKSLFRYIINTWIFIIAAWTIAFWLSGLAECGSHLKALFGTPQSYLQHCGAAIRAGWAMVCSDVGSDIITLIIPIPMIWTLQMPLHRKVLLATTFMVGLLSVGAGIGKAYIYITASLGIGKLDGILTITGFTMWNLIEVQVGIIATCAALLRPVLREVIPGDSLIALVQSLRNRLSTSRRSQSSQKLPPHSKSADPANIANSDEQLVRSFNHQNKSRTDTFIEDVELQSAKERHDGAMQPDEIHVRKNLTVERF